MRALLGAVWPIRDDLRQTTTGMGPAFLTPGEPATIMGHSYRSRQGIRRSALSSYFYLEIPMSTQNPIDNQYQAMEARLLQLESTLRRFKWCVVLVVLAGCGLGASQSVKDSSAGKESDAEGEYIEKLRVGTLEVQKDGNFGDKAGWHVRVSAGSVSVRNTTKNTSVVLFPTSVMITDEDNESYMGGGELIFSRLDQRKNREWRELLGKGKRSEAERQRLRQLSESRAPKALRIGIGDNGGGMIDVFSPLKKRVVSIQSNKANQGGVYLGDVNGEIQKILSVD